MWRFAAIAILLLISTGPVEAKRVKQDEKAALKEARAHALNEGGDASDDSLEQPLLKLAPEAGSFVCPVECQECCQQPKYYLIETLARQDQTAFKCIMPKESMAGFKIAGRTCGKARLRRYDPSLGQAKCDLTAAEKEDELYKDLAKCTYEPHVQTSEQFLGSDRYKDYCSVSQTGSFFGLELKGAAIDKMLFTVKDRVTGGVCGTKAKALAKDGLLKNVCPDGAEECHARVEEGLCQMLAGDEAAGRLDGVSMALWASTVGALRNDKFIPKPSGPLRVLRKFTVPGWKARSAPFEMPAHDRQISLDHGLLQCVMGKLKDYPLDDGFDGPTRNSYVKKDASVTDGVSVWAPSDNTDVRINYYERFGIYQEPLHFAVPAGELQSDHTLEKLVFGNIGAHRVEPIVEDQAVNLNPIGIPGLPTAAVPGSEKGLLRSLPVDVQKEARYIVRLEGLAEAGNIPTREGMGHVGGNAFFDSKGKLLALQYRGETLVKDRLSEKGDAEKWEAFKFIFRSSLVVFVTVFEHLVSTHILASESLAVATAETLPANHGLRQLLTPHTWGSLAINMQASLNLFAKNMLVHRASPFADEAFQSDDGSDGKLWQMIPLLRYTKFTELYDKYLATKQIIDGPEMPFFEDGKLLFDALHNYVESFVHAIYGKPSAGCNKALQADVRAMNFVKNFFDQNSATPEFWKPFKKADRHCGAFVDLVGEVIFLVTGWHRHVGSVADFFRDTRFASASWKDGETEGRPKHSMLMQFLAFSTNAIAPHLEDNLVEVYQNDSPFSGLFNKLYKDMAAVQKEVEMRNKKRKEGGHIEFHQMEPKYVEWGVEV